MKGFYTLLLSFFCGTTVCLAQPSIASFAPASGPIGTLVTISGTNFDTTPTNNIVFFGATQATVSTATIDEITVTVPLGATYMPITIVVNGLLAWSSAPFVVTFGAVGIDTNSFDAKVDLTTGDSPFSIGDLDGDGKSDLVVTNKNSHTVSVFRNTNTSTGTISYAPKVDYTTGTLSFPRSVSIGDLDGDGKADLVVVNIGTLSVFRNISTNPGIISYNPKLDFAIRGTRLSSSLVSIGDLDGDGKADLAVVNSDMVSIFRNTSTSGGNISYATKVDYPTGSGPNSVAIGDLDGDGKSDLVVVNVFDNTVSVYRNTSTSTGTISFAAKVDYTTGSLPVAVSIGDLDGDGMPDLAVANDFHSISLFRNTSTGVGTISYDSKVDYPTGFNPSSLALGDLDGDGKVDLAITNFHSNTVSVFRNNNTSIGIISFASKVDFPTGIGSFPRSVSIGDLDDDGKVDLAVANGSNTNFMASSVSLLRNITIPRSAETDIIAFSFSEQTYDAILDDIAHTVNVEVDFGTDLTDLVSIFSLSPGAIAEVNDILQASGVTANDFTIQVTYSVIAENGITKQDWVITVASIVLGIKKTSKQVQIFPNPTSNRINIITEDFVFVSLIQTSGREILRSFKKQLELTEVPPGFYILIVHGNSKKPAVYRIIKK